jgi:uncharacterized protein (TIGR03086 family)
MCRRAPTRCRPRLPPASCRLKFLVHAWDYAVTVGRDVKAPDSLAEYVLGLARELIRPEERSRAGFHDPVEAPENASALDQLIAFTGRNPAP